ncbi:MAG: hypothetical protein AB4368_26970 [Xenococcaceae cyanobacterium]
MAKRTSQSLMQKIFADAEERRYKAIYYVAKEVSGRALSRVHKEKGKKFNWDAFSKKFEQSHGKYSTDELLTEILENVYWLTSEAEVMELYFRYMRDIDKASGKQKESENDDLDFS